MGSACLGILARAGLLLNDSIRKITATSESYLRPFMPGQHIPVHRKLIEPKVIARNHRSKRV